MYVSLTCKNV